MKTICTKCSQEIDLPDDAAGKTVACPACGTQFNAEEAKPCRHCGAMNSKSASKCIKCGKAMLSIGIRKPGNVSSGAVAEDAPKVEAPSPDRPKIGIRKPGSASVSAETPKEAPAAVQQQEPAPQPAVKKIELKATAAQESPAPEAEKGPSVNPAPAPGAAPKLSLNIPKPGATTTPSAAPGATPKLSLNIPKPGAPAAGAAPKLSLNIPKPGAAAQAPSAAGSSAPKLNLTPPAPSVPKPELKTPAQATAVKNAEKPKEAGKKEEKKKSPGLSDGAKKALKIAAIVIVVLIVLAGAGAGAFIYLRGPTEADKQVEKAKSLAAEGDIEKAIVMLEKAVAQGNKEACAILGEYYLSGQGVTQNDKKAAELFAKAGENAAAEYKLGLLYAEGKGVEQDLVKAAKLYTSAEKHGSAEAGVELAKCYAQGLGVKKDERKAIPFRQKSADEGNAESQYIMAGYLLAGVLMPFNPEKAVEYLNAAIKQGHIPSQYLLAECEMFGLGTKQDSEQAKKDFTQAFESAGKAVKEGKGSQDDTLTMAKCLLYGNGAKKDVRQAKALLNSPALKKNAEAITILAQETQDVKQKTNLLKQASGMGYSEAQWQLAQLLEKTDAKQAEQLYKNAKEGGSVSAYAAAAKFHLSSAPDKAFEDCKFAADRKNPSGMYLFAECLENGQGTKKDAKQAVDLYWFLAFHPSVEQDAAAKKLVALCSKKEYQADLIKRLKDLMGKGTDEEKKLVKKQMGTMCLNGIGMPKNTAAAVTFYWEAGAIDELSDMLKKGIEVGRIVPLLTKAADSGNTELQFYLAKLMLEGRSVPVNQAKAAVLMKKAADSGNAEAQYEIGRIYCQDSGRDLIEHDPDYSASKVERSLPDALNYFRKAASAGHVQAQYRYAKTLLNVKKVPDGIKDRNAEAIVWLKKAADSKCVPAEFLLAMVRLESGKKDKASLEQILQGLNSAAESGYAPAMFAMGEVAAASGDTAQAEIWYNKAADKKYVPALIILGHGPKNMSLIKAAAAAGYTPAVAEEGLDLLRRDRKADANKKLDRAKKHGFNAVSNALGVCIATEKKKMAEKYFRDAAKHGSAYAEFNLGVLAYKEANLGKGDFETVQKIFRDLGKNHPDFKMPSDLNGRIAKQINLENKFRDINAKYKDYCSQGASARIGNKKVKIDASEEDKKKADAMLKERDEINAEISKLVNSIKKDLEWKIEPNFSDALRHAPSKVRYPRSPDIDLAVLKAVYKK